MDPLPGCRHEGPIGQGAHVPAAMAAKNIGIEGG